MGGCTESIIAALMARPRADAGSTCVGEGRRRALTPDSLVASWSAAPAPHPGFSPRRAVENRMLVGLRARVKEFDLASFAGPDRTARVVTCFRCSGGLGRDDDRRRPGTALSPGYDRRATAAPLDAASPRRPWPATSGRSSGSPSLGRARATRRSHAQERAWHRAEGLDPPRAAALVHLAASQPRTQHRRHCRPGRAPVVTQLVRHGPISERRRWKRRSP